MAEIKIEKKNQIWPWLALGAVLVALLLYFFVFNNKKESVAEDKNTPAATDLINVHENNIIPIGLAILDDENKCVICNEVNYSSFSKVGRFKKGTVINREYEITLMRNYIPTKIIDRPSSISDNFYDGKEFENTLKRNKN